jgi:hypothetical protein
MGLFKTAVRQYFGPNSQTAKRLIDTTNRLRLPLTDRLLDLPAPLVNSEHSMLVLWNAKSASSTTLLWYFASLGLLDDVIASGLSPHAYRGQRFPGTGAHKRNRATKVLDDYFVVHVIRDPYLRAVSSYRHTLATGYADKRLAGRLDRRAGFSFSRYLDYLQSIDLARANVHHKLQRHRVEELRRADRVINVSRQDLLVELNRLERERGMKVTDFSAFGDLLEQQETRRARETGFSGEDVADRPLDVAAARGEAPWPHYRQFLNPTTRGRIELLYAPDFQLFRDYL